MTSASPTPLATTIREAREQQGLSREALAGKADVSLRTIVRLEEGEAVPRRATLKVITLALGLDPLEEAA